MTNADFLTKKDYFSEEVGKIPISEEEITEICELENLCYAPGEEYDKDLVESFISEKGAMLIRAYHNLTLIGLQLSNVKKRELITLDIHPEFRRKGLGKKLLNLTLSEFIKAGCKKVHCQIALNNIPSLMLHLKFGFKPLFIIPFYYPDGQSAYWLEKKLTKNNSH